MDTQTKIIAALVLVGGVYIFYRIYILPMLRRNELMREYQNLAEPRLIAQVGENEDEFWARVQRERARFTSVGNRWAEKQVPVIAIPQNAAFTIEWFGKQYDYSTVGMGQMEFHRMAFEVYVKHCNIWSNETKLGFGEKVHHAKGQKEFDETQLWN